MYLLKEEINDLISSKSLIIRPLLQQSQVSEITLDLRLGYDFLVSIQGRSPYINASKNELALTERPVNAFFQETRRRLGETFLLHPNQTVLTTSLEYIKLPEDVFMEINMRSSYTRLGMTVSTIVQPGYCGCLSLELINNGKSAINFTVGARVVQARLIRISSKAGYFKSTGPRKYICQVRPEVSAVNQDPDLTILHDIWLAANHQNET